MKMSDKSKTTLIKLRLKPSDIDFITRVFEGYDGLGMVSTLDRKEGLVGIWVTPDTRDEVLIILSRFPRDLEIVE